MVDDLKPAIGAFGDELAVTPNLDRLTRRGVHFDRAYCNQAVCAPSRFNLMTGMRSTTSGLFGLGSQLREAHPNVVTLPQAFRRLGYHAEAIGKVFHFGHGNIGDPESWSIDPWKESPIDYAMLESTGGELTREEALFANWNEGNPWQLPRGAAWERADVEDDVYAEGRIAREAVRRLRSHAESGQPFMMAVGFTKPHLPFAAPEKYWQMYDPADFELARITTPPRGAPEFAPKTGIGELGAYSPIPRDEPISDDLARTLIHGYYASTSYMDAQAGLVLDELARLGLEDDTIVVLWGDHGFHLGDLGTWTKHTNYEQAVRIPLVVAGPGVSQGASTSFAETVDIFPTLLELAGFDANGMTQRLDGVSLAPTLSDPGNAQRNARNHAYHAFNRGPRIGHAIRTERYRMVEWRHRNGSPPVYELYDYAEGDVETVNIADGQPEVLAEHIERLRRHDRGEEGIRGRITTIADVVDRDVAPKPLFVDPNYHGSCDPEIVWNPATREWLIFYTGRRALAEDGNTPAGTPIGVAASKDWRTWAFRGYCSFDGRDNTADADRTYWAPAVVVDGDTLHMYVTFKPQATGFWGGPGEGIRHYTASTDDPLEWAYQSLSVAGEEVIDAGLINDGDRWLMYYRDEPDSQGVTSFVAESSDLNEWQELGPVVGDVNRVAVHGHRYQEAQYPFRWAGSYWKLTDPSGLGLSVYRSPDGFAWTYVGELLEGRGEHPTDTNGGRHPSVAVVDGRAFLFYHVEPNRPQGPYRSVRRLDRRTFLQIVELTIDEGGELRADRNRSVELPSAEVLAEGPSGDVDPGADEIHNSADPKRWSIDRAHRWHRENAWPIGANFVPSTAINQLEMWQAETFDPETIDRELGWAARAGMNVMRVYLHDIAWRQDPEGFFDRVDRYLEIADSHGISTMFVIWDGVWNPEPNAGPQPEPIPHTHNSGWVQSPGAARLSDPSTYPELEQYVKAVISRYAEDHRVFAWDLFNEPDMHQSNRWGDAKLPRGDKMRFAAMLLERTFDWAREIDPDQPLTAGVWGGGPWLDGSNAVATLSLARSDVITFHIYDGPSRLRERIAELQTFGRPIICTEYLARTNNSTFQNALPIMFEHRIGAIHWGLVAGRSQTQYPWDSWERDYTSEPDVWFHDVFRPNGQPYDREEIQLIQRLRSDDRFVVKPSEDRPQDPSPADELRDAIARHDRAVFVLGGWIRDPFITLAEDGFYYLTGTTPNPDHPRQINDPYNTGLGLSSIVGYDMQVWRSRDLAEWESLGTVYTLFDGIWDDVRPDNFLGDDRSQWRLWAPELHRIDGRWAIVHTSPSPVQGANLSFTQGSELNGPFENPMGEGIGRRHDPSLFKDIDGTWWMIWGATQIAPLRDDFTGFAGPPRRIRPTGDSARMGHEGCLIHRIGDQYVLFGTGWSTGRMRRGSYNLYYAVADELEGPYSERKFVGRFLGHGTPFQDSEGRWWCTAFFNANAPPVETDGLVDRDLSRNALTVNEQGVTLVPLDVYFDDGGELIIRAKDPLYRNPGPDESQHFETIPVGASASR